MKHETLLPGQRPTQMGRREDQFGKAMHSEIYDLASEKGINDMDILLMNNTIGSARKDTEEMLYVPSRPHEARPYDHTGVVVKLDGQNGVELHLNDPSPAPSEMEPMMQLQSEHELCLACTDAIDYFCHYRELRWTWHEDDEDDQQFPLPSNVVHHYNLWSLMAFAEIHKCFICQELWTRIQAAYPSLEPEQLLKFRMECAWRKRRQNTEEDKIFFVMFDPDIPKEPVWNYKYFMRLSLWRTDHFSSHFDPTLESDDVQGADLGDLSPESYHSNDSPVTNALIRSWLRKCKTNADGKHDECNKQYANYLPTRLLDVRMALASDRVLLLCSATDPSRFDHDRSYASLSHCWGTWGAKENPVLLIENLAARQQQGLELNSFPKTFRDAIRIAGSLGINWIWIDSLCIIQNSTSDWLKGASLMDQTYQHAVLNISADHGEDSRAGCFVERHPLDIRPIQFESSKSKVSWQVTFNGTFRWTRTSPSFHRAWIMRERQLARRILHFTNKEVVWECCGVGNSSFASESLPGGAPFKTVFDDQAKFQTGRLQQTLGDHLEETYALWNDICEDLSRKSLTHATDMPIILSSLAKEFHRVLRTDEYCSGLWRSTLPQSLAWSTISWAPGDNREYIAPSWSWMSAATDVKLALQSSHRNVLPLAEVACIDNELKHGEPYGALRSGILHMDGFLRQVRLDFEPDGRCNLSVFDRYSDDDDGDTPPERTRLIGPSWDDYEGDMCTAELDSPPDNLSIVCFAFLVGIDEWISDNEGMDSNGRTIRAILLELVGGTNGAFRRIGALTLRDLYSLKIRYRVVSICEPGKQEQETAVDESWVAMAEYIKIKRWSLVETPQSERHRHASEDRRSESDKSIEARQESNSSIDDLDQEQDGDSTEDSARDEIRERILDLLPALQPHASVSEDAEIEEAMTITSMTERGGTRLPPHEALYQFDDALDKLREQQKRVPWLQRLRPTRVMVI
ncbi:hypothetical protein PV11_05468 [Exophiala sideris]|uniref:Heterokaryon incompatibility domain-containing protein n=1 Tax=Exophiala sideris TaxID=1016849 RepID=A0A0D1YQ73_9EURO|nr:hypothetical protein PV11_05468 [Exophiala sideris]